VKKVRSWPLFYPLILLSICLFICFKNYTPNTFLTGWDTLHPEFNFSINFKRLIFGVWRSDQGLGDLAGHSAMADLPRVIILWVFHFFLPLNFLRYSYIFLCLILGTLSFFYLIKYLFKKFPHSSILAFISALAYLLNLGTMQQFYVPFEMFTTQWAFLPLLILFSLKYLHSKKSTYLFIYLLLTFFAAPQAYAAQLWYAFFVVYILFLTLYSLFHHNRYKNSLILLLITLFANSFWLLPNLHYALTSSKNPLINRSNRLYSQEYLLQNRATGTLDNTSLIKGFYFNWNEYSFNLRSSQNLTETWNKHLQNYDVFITGHLIFFLSFSGLIAAFMRKDKNFISLSVFFIIPFFLLANSTPIIRIPFDLLLKNTLFQELFRFIFTKVSILFTLALNLYLAYTLNLIFSLFSKKYIKIFSLIFSFSLIIYAFPFFKGHLISPIIRINIPDNYFNLYKFLQKQSDGRILTLPLHEFSGWQYYDWHYQGSGFIWFGFPQSILDRDSDRWEVKNEQSYREFYYTLYSKNQDNFYNSLLKYKVKYILWDQAIIPSSPKNREQITFRLETLDILNSLLNQNKITFLKQFGSVFLYEVNQNQDLIQLQAINNFIGPEYVKNYWDSQFSGNDYLTTNTTKDQNYPLRRLLNEIEQVNTQLLEPSLIQHLHAFSAPQLYQYNSRNPNLKLINNSLQITSLNSVQGLEINLPLSHSNSYLFTFKSKYLSGLPIRFCLRNDYTNLCVIEDQLDRQNQFHQNSFLVPPLDNFSGYTLSLNTISFASFPSISQIESLDIYQVDNNIFNLTPTQKNETYPINYQIIWPNYSLIKINNIKNNSDNQYLSLNQSFNSGWLAFYFDNFKIKSLPHFLVNNWANGWEIPNETNFDTERAESSDFGTERAESSDFGTERSRPFPTIYILFWPQILQFFGFGLLIIAIIWLLKNFSDSR